MILRPTKAKVILGQKAFRIWLETDAQHDKIAAILEYRIQTGRPVLVHEPRFPDRDPIDLEPKPTEERKPDENEDTNAPGRTGDIEQEVPPDGVR